MDIKCPLCHKINTEESCMRCKTDLSKLIEISTSAKYLLDQGVHCLHKNDIKNAQSLTYKSWNLKHSKDAAYLGLASSCMDKDDTMARHWIKKIIG